MIILSLFLLFDCKYMSNQGSLWSSVTMIKKQREGAQKKYKKAILFKEKDSIIFVTPQYTTQLTHTSNRSSFLSLPAHNLLSHKYFYSHTLAHNSHAFLLAYARACAMCRSNGANFASYILSATFSPSVLGSRSGGCAANTGPSMLPSPLFHGSTVCIPRVRTLAHP